MDNKNESITHVFKCTINGEEYYVYSTTSNNSDSYKYFTLSVVNNTPKIDAIENIVNFLENVKNKLIEIRDNSVEYIKFLALKSSAENEFLLKIKSSKR